jgi:hypothetical protein
MFGRRAGKMVAWTFWLAVMPAFVYVRRFIGTFSFWGVIGIVFASKAVALGSRVR